MQTLGKVEFHPNFRRFVFRSIVVHPVFFDLGQSGMGGWGWGWGGCKYTFEVSFTSIISVAIPLVNDTSKAKRGEKKIKSAVESSSQGSTAHSITRHFNISFDVDTVGTPDARLRT